MNIVICNSQSWFELRDDISLEHNILSIKDKSELCANKLRNFKPDFIFFPHWNWIVEKEIFSHFNCIVFHTAPLPYGRGGSPIQNLISRGYKKSPVCALKMCEGIDNGPIYKQKDISLEGSLSDIFKRLNVTVNQLIKSLIKHLPEPKAQDGLARTFKRLEKKDNKINLEATFEEVYDAIRMVDDPSYPNAYLSLQNILIEFSQIEKTNDQLFCRVRISNKGSI